MIDTPWEGMAAYCEADSKACIIGLRDVEYRVSCQIDPSFCERLLKLSVFQA